MPTENNPMKSAIDRRLSALCVPDDMAQRIQAAAQKKKAARYPVPPSPCRGGCILPDISLQHGRTGHHRPLCAKSVCHSGHTDIFHAAAH